MLKKIIILISAVMGATILAVSFIAIIKAIIISDNHSFIEQIEINFNEFLNYYFYIALIFLLIFLFFFIKDLSKNK